MTLRSHSIILAVLLAGVACEKDSKKTLDPSEYPKNVGDPAIVEMAEAGRTPHQPLRLKPAVDTEQKVQMNLEMDMKGPMAAAAPNMNMSMNMAAKVTKVEANGNFHTEMGFEGIKFADPQLESMGMGDMLNGMKMTQITSERGVMEGGGVQLPPDLAMLKPMFDDSMKQLAFALPKESVGIGASWPTKETLEKNNVRVYQEITFTVAELAKNQAKLKMKLMQQAPSQTIDMMGQKVKVEKLESKGTGSATLAFDKPLPTAMNLTMDMTTKMSVNGQSVAMDMGLKVDMTSK